jgi:thymidylate synthase
MHEVANGTHGERVEGWSYSYYDRLFNWPGKVEKIMTGEVLEIPHVNQIEEVINGLAKTPYTRRAQAITWYPLIDSRHHEPPCLQRVWCQVVKSGEDLLLEMNTHWRSRDAFKASFMNIFALTQLQKNITDQLSLKIGKKVEVGRYCDYTDNFHIYGSYIRRGEMDGFLQSLQKRSFEQRTYKTSDPLVQQEFGIADEKILLDNK